MDERIRILKEFDKINNNDNKKSEDNVIINLQT